ncbi:hypothetical protein OJ997_00340 [Solirubrobacter phytolaccae]|uniref:Uncharacterized protein n=1 Tax=Solirubrobacter phytolaccae TaxID=1404360 RepID=A0A9X3N3E2_9ACTN|nr:hypothetical protein [Solirubrobacter phytolaccae]MDA0178726.1 hypothetical protein [Solirubrobacter phytolaccae]
MTTPDQLKTRLRIYRFGQRRSLNALAERFADEPIDAVTSGLWRRRGWLAAASPAGVELIRRPYLAGRARDVHFPWSELTAVETGGSGMSLTLRFQGRDVRLGALGPPDEYARFVDTARGHLPGAAVETAARDVRAEVRAALGRWATFELDAAIVALPERLEPGEVVEGVAAATLDFRGLLVVTDRRVLLLGRAPGQALREWSTHRSWVRAADVVEDGLRLDLGVEVVQLAQVLPEDARAALADLISPPAPAPEARADETPSGPDRPWELTAAEAYLLRYLQEGAAVEEPVFRLALIELVARGVLRVEPVWVRRRLRPGWRFDHVFTAGPRLALAPAALRPLVAAFERARAGDGVVRARAYADRERAVEGVRLDALGKEDLALTAACVESLVEHGLARKPLTRTEDGVAADAAVGEWLALARGRFAERAAGDATWATAFLHGAGAAVLLPDVALPALARCGERWPDEPWLDVRLGAARGLPDAVAAIDAAFRVIKPKLSDSIDAVLDDG